MFSDDLFVWFDRSQRPLPWRLSPPNPYYTWLSEIMLQQTTVTTVIPYFQEFIQTWPTVQDLAAASLDQILVKWQGLGYYSRARNLHACAQYLALSFPQTEKELIKLPGIGPYTAAAIASIAFEQKAAAVDGNVMRVLSRYLALDILHSAKDMKPILASYLPNSRYGDFTQALMELGALVCRPKNPGCRVCPLAKNCKAHLQGRPEDFPKKPGKIALPIRYTTAFIIRRGDGAILLRKRPQHGLLGGMMEVPTTPWEEGNQIPKGKRIRHTFTHFHLEVDVQERPPSPEFEGLWVHPREFHKYALPTLMKKILKSTSLLPQKGK